ncbi:MAG TPA: hypothetical protein VFL65_00790 [Jatrophihabitans sp.]|nr:hypothetical protein [Jatrophihabitans sp.]
MPGPAPSPNARRRNDRDAWRTLPAMCALPAPAWPLKGRKPAGLVDLWRYLWSLPVAAIWHEQSAARLVARYALLTLAAEDVQRADTVKLAAEVRQIEDRLLISPSTRIRARVLVEPAAPAEGKPAEVSDLDERRRRRLAG